MRFTQSGQWDTDGLDTRKSTQQREARTGPSGTFVEFIGVRLVNTIQVSVVRVYVHHL